MPKETYRQVLNIGDKPIRSVATDWNYIKYLQCELKFHAGSSYSLCEYCFRVNSNDQMKKNARGESTHCIDCAERILSFGGK